MPDAPDAASATPATTTAATPAASTAPAGPRPAIIARGLALTGDRGAVYGPLDFDIPAGGLHLIRGRSGDGRTCLGLTLAGRMRQSAGTLDVLGSTSTRRIHARACIAGFRDIDQLDPGITVRALLTEQLRWLAPWWRFVPNVDQKRVDALCAPVFGPHPRPRVDAHIDDLGELDRMLLRITLATSAEWEILVIDDLEQVRLADERAFFCGRLAALAAERTVLALAIDELPPGSPPHTVHPILAAHPVTDPTTGVTTDETSEEPSR